MDHKKVVCKLEQELEAFKSSMQAKTNSPSPKGDHKTGSSQSMSYFAGRWTAYRADYKKVTYKYMYHLLVLHSPNHSMYNTHSSYFCIVHVWYVCKIIIPQ